MVKSSLLLNAEFKFRLLPSLPFEGPDPEKPNVHTRARERYEEAELARDRLAELRTQEEQRRRAELRSLLNAAAERRRRDFSRSLPKEFHIRNVMCQLQFIKIQCNFAKFQERMQRSAKIRQTICGFFTDSAEFHGSPEVM